VVPDHNKYLLLSIIFDNTDDKLQKSTENFDQLPRISKKQKKIENEDIF